MEDEKGLIENITLPELYADLSARLDVSEPALVALFRRIFEANPKFLLSGNWSVGNTPEGVLVTRENRLSYLLGTIPYKELDKVSGNMVDKKQPILIRRLQKTYYPAHHKSGRTRRGHGPDKDED